MSGDLRKQGNRNPNIDLKGFIYSNFKDIIATILIIFFIIILVMYDKDLSEGLSTLLYSLTSGAAGFIFGKRVN